MASFRDKFDREWDVEITRDMLPGLRAAGFDVGKVVKDATQFAVLDDPDRFGQILWVLCAEQVAAKGLDEVQFSRGFNGEAVGAACDAIAGAVSDFIHRRPAVAKAVREALPRVMAEQDATAVRMVEEAAARAVEKLRTMTPSGSTGSATN